MKIKESHIARINLDWDNIPTPVVNTPPDYQTIQKDLDITGNRSLQHLLDVCVSFEGSSHLRKKISIQSPEHEEIILNQNLINELKDLSLFRDKFLLKANITAKKALDCNSILNWFKNDSEVSFSKWILPLSFLLIITYITLFILSVSGVAVSGWLIVFLIYFFTYSSQQKKIKKIIEQSSGADSHIKKFIALFFFIDSQSFNEGKPSIKEFLNEITGEANNSAAKLKNLQKYITALSIRENPVLRLILNFVFPYDLIFCKKLIRVKSEIREQIPLWIGKLNELECLISLSNFAYLNPEYVFPEINTGSNYELNAQALGHPLIKTNRKICNDFSFAKKNEIVIITGSNMSGKSTFLKTVGINFCLANAGAPVNAMHFKTSLYELFTCIKVNDSVSDGISYFYAEVKRLKELLDKLHSEKQKPVLFLVDEIFKGTNNKERLAGSRAFIKKLSDLNGCGFISTHDLELVNLANEISSITNFHFREMIVNGKMEFDYKIYGGPCPTTNALKIMEMSGLL